MLSRSQKINTRLFKDILNKGKKYNSAYFFVKVLNNSDKSSQSRFTCVVSKKIIKSAVKRNLFKRRFFNIIKEIYTELPSSVMMIFFLKKGGEQLMYKDLKKEILKIVKH